MPQDQNPNGENDNSNQDGNNVTPPKPDENTNAPTDIDSIVKAKLDEALKDIKGKLDKAYGARDDALKKIAEIEQKEREAELKRLQDEGKHKEAYEMQLAQERAAREALEKRNVELTRDIEVRNALSTHPFRNENALEMAYKEITGQLVKNENGVWVHTSGANIRDFVKGFAESQDNSFLFKPKVSTGAGSSESSSNPGSSEKKSLFQMSQAEVLKMAREGKLR